MADEAEVPAESTPEPYSPAPPRRKRVKTAIRSEEVEIEGANGVEVYTIREMNGTERDNFLNENATRTKTDSKGNPTGLKDFKGCMSMLICKCLFDSQMKRVSRQIIDGWGCTAQTELFLLCQDINGFGDDKDAAKKD